MIREIADKQAPNDTEYGLFGYSAGPVGKGRMGADTRKMLDEFVDRRKSLMLNRYWLNMHTPIGQKCKYQEMIDRWTYPTSLLRSRRKSRFWKLISVK